MGDAEMQRRRIVISTVALTIWLSACGSSSSTMTRETTPSESTGPINDLRWGYAEVAVAHDFALVADGTIPTNFSIADLTATDPEHLAPMKAPVDLMVRRIANLGDSFLVAGNRCDEVNPERGVDAACAPNTAVMFTYDPARDEWAEIAIPIDQKPFGRVYPPVTDGPIATLAVTAEGGPLDQQWQFLTVDVTKARAVPQPMPSDFAPSATGVVAPCLAADGSATLISVANVEDLPGTSETKVWRRKSPDVPWTGVDLPPNSAYQWHYADCNAGILSISIQDAGRRRTVHDDATTRSWQDQSGDVLPAGAAASGFVSEPGRTRRWVDGRVWRFDPTTFRYVDTGVPKSPLNGVLTGAAWKDDKVIALLNGHASSSGEDKQDLRIQIVAGT